MEKSKLIKKVILIPLVGATIFAGSIFGGSWLGKKHHTLKTLQRNQIKENQRIEQENKQRINTRTINHVKEFHNYVEIKKTGEDKVLLYTAHKNGKEEVSIDYPNKRLIVDYLDNNFDGKADLVRYGHNPIYRNGKHDGWYGPISLDSSTDHLQKGDEHITNIRKEFKDLIPFQLIRERAQAVN